MESNAAMMVLRPALKTGFCRNTDGVRLLCSPPYYVPRYFSGRMSLLHGEGRQFESVTRYQYPIGEMNITLCYERRSGGLIPSLGARFRKMGRMVMQQIANLSS